MGGFTFRAFVMYIVLLITFLGLINMIFNLHRFAFILEFLILLGLVLVAMLSAIGINSDSKWAWILLTLFFGFVFIDMLLIRAISTERIPYFLQLIFATIAGFFISFFSIEKEEIEEPEEEPVKKTFKPGKYIASKTGTKFHAPRSEWGKKIKKKNAVWFDSKEDATQAGYNPGDGVE